MTPVAIALIHPDVISGVCVVAYTRRGQAYQLRVASGYIQQTSPGWGTWDNYAIVAIDELIASATIQDKEA